MPEGEAGRPPTRHSAVDEAASMDVLCADKTGTLTRNELTVTRLRHAGLRRGARPGAGGAGEQPRSAPQTARVDSKTSICRSSRSDGPSCGPGAESPQIVIDDLPGELVALDVTDLEFCDGGMRVHIRPEKHPSTEATIIILSRIKLAVFGAGRRRGWRYGAPW
jgi:hypothetical protein